MGTREKADKVAEIEKGREHAFLNEAKEEGFKQFVRTISKTMYALPLAWALVVALNYNKVPTINLVTWVAAFFVVWVVSLVALRNYREHPSLAKHLIPLYIIVAAEGVLLGAMFYALMGHHIDVDTWVAVVLLGIVSVVLPTYITFPRAFHVLLLSVWVSAAVSMLLIAHRYDMALKASLTLLVYFLALVYIIRPISGRVLEGIRLHLVNKNLTERLRESLAVVSHQAATDALTGQLNRHALNKALNDLIVKGERRNAVFSLLMLDIDFFKSINDTYGHDVGDRAIQHAGQVIAEQLRDDDLCARFGGEEFVVLLPALDEEKAVQVAERIRLALEASPLENPHHTMTLSIGVATYKSGVTAESLLKAADDGVYAAKHQGRNQVCVALGDHHNVKAL
ncbi:MAG: GGDEF domain-containing protein [Idiomarina sp.]|nr:GGDEF domain-containing protein [Idiomarina sp.]